VHSQTQLSHGQVFMDVSDIVEYNASILSTNSLNDSFFCLSKDDPTVGFAFDATKLAGNAFPASSIETLGTF
jgi:DNA polymerase iota